MWKTPTTCPDLVPITISSALLVLMSLRKMSRVSVYCNIPLSSPHGQMWPAGDCASAKLNCFTQSKSLFEALMWLFLTLSPLLVAAFGCGAIREAALGAGRARRLPESRMPHRRALVHQIWWSHCRRHIRTHTHHYCQHVIASCAWALAVRWANNFISEGIVRFNAQWA